MLSINTALWRLNVSVLNTISGVTSAINVGGSALSLLGMGSALIKTQKKGIDGFEFDIKVTENVTMNANITDHYTEENASVQDHIAFDPIKITLVGKIGELVHYSPAGLAFLNAAIDRLQPLGVLSPAQGAQAKRYLSAASQVNTALDTLKKTWSNLSDVISNTPSLNKQQEAFKKLKEFYDKRALLSVETPWQTFQNMAIENFTADQDESNVMETTFTITFKEMRFVSTKTFEGKLFGRIAEQAAPVTAKGTQPTQNKSIGASIFDAITK